MSAIAGTMLTAMLAGATGASGSATCFHAADESRGWKKVAIPDSVRSLSAPTPVPQIRLGGEIHTISTDSPKVFVENAAVEHGQEQLRFSVDKGSYALTLKFAEGLKGAKVDVIARTSTGTTHPLWHERRIRDAVLDLSWEVARVSGIDVIVHNHLRERPSLSHWTVHRRIKVSEDPTGLPEFQEPRTLYYFNEGGKDVSLCDQETTPSAFDNDLLAGAKPVSVQLKPMN